MHEWWIPVLAVLAVGVLLVAVPKLVAVWLVGRKHRAAEGQGNDPQRRPNAKRSKNGGR